MNIIAVDPGGTTGFCYGDLNKDGIELYPFQIPDDVDEFWQRLYKFKPNWIVIEDFEFRQGSRAGLNLFPVQLIGVARLYEMSEGCRLTLQKASVGKSYYTDIILKKLGLNKRGIPHGMDATRHLLQWLTFGPGYQYLGKAKISEFARLIDTWEI